MTINTWITIHYFITILMGNYLIDVRKKRDEREERTEEEIKRERNGAIAARVISFIPLLNVVTTLILCYNEMKYQVQLGRFKNKCRKKIKAMLDAADILDEIAETREDEDRKKNIHEIAGWIRTVEIPI